MSAPLTDQDRVNAMENIRASLTELADELKIIDALDAHRLQFDDSRNLGYYRTFIECSCGAGWWYGDHDGDPSGADRWAIHRAQVLAEQFRQNGDNNK